MKKLLTVIGIILAVLLALLLTLSVLVKSYLKSEKLKSLIIPRAEEYTGRKVDIEEISVSLFKGIAVKGITVKEKDGAKDFVSVKEFVLDYNLMPLLKKRLEIKSIGAVSPRVFIRKEADGRYNFSDILERKPTAKAEPQKDAGAFPLSIVTDRIFIKDAGVEFADAGKTLPDAALKADIELKVAFKDGFEIASASGVVDVLELKAAVGGIDTNTSGRVELDGKAINVNLNTAIVKDAIGISGTIKDYMTAPDIVLNVNTKELDLERLIPKTEKQAVSKGRATMPPSKEKPVKAEKKVIKASGEIRAGALRYGGYTLRDFALNYKFAENTMVIEPIGFHIAGGQKVKAEGPFKAGMRFNLDPESADAAALIKKTLSGAGSVNLTKCKLEESKLTGAIAAFTGLEELRSPGFDSVKMNFTIKNERADFSGGMDSAHIIIIPSGSAGFDKKIDVLADLKLSPALSSKMPTGKAARYLTDERGWTVLPLKITGTLEKPSVGLNPKAVGKQIERGVKEEIRKIIQEPEFLKGIFGK